ncbi:hypothetical protein KDK95_30215 [Actinospica sp. MGRD01-02]|uniref:Uncharacterized protein n=1 Tax=Actinospica acidithermotolerans TaxID=2828514 RepID=A0A941ED98_9ACTN|nr:hypothetical protein [Actinospica acidithermotolerans]MBR7830615.1 hypothetical protein [Actinospica acidithermotolerans]
MSEPDTPNDSRASQHSSSQGRLPDSDKPEAETAMPTCPKCPAGVGDLHADWCTIAWCATDGRQRYGRCDVFHGCHHDPRYDCRTAWTGLYPGFAECRALGWFAVLTPEGWIPVSPGTSGAIEDLNRLMRHAVWNHCSGRYEAAEPQVPPDTPPATGAAADREPPEPPD